MEGFDQSASTYDKEFTFSTIGQFQRKRVWSYLEDWISKDKKLSILELNSGTGEDAIWLAKKGHRVLASDYSKAMISQIKRKKDKILDIDLEICELDLKEPNIPANKEFDLIFSNFGGINCINLNHLTNLSKTIHSVLKKDGHFIAILMPRHCIIEKWYRWKKNQLNIYHDRSPNNGIGINVNGVSINTYFFNVDDVKNAFSKWEFVKASSIGFIPSYLESSRFLSILKILESILLKFSLSPNRADHYLIHFKKKG